MRWIHGIIGIWNVNGHLYAAYYNRKNIYDYLTDRYAWIQQESCFWRRSLYVEAGCRVSNNYKYMIDAELWSRFFLIEKLYSVDCLLSGFRVHANYRSGNNIAECHREMAEIIASMRSQCKDDCIRRARLLSSPIAKPGHSKNRRISN